MKGIFTHWLRHGRSADGGVFMRLALLLVVCMTSIGGWAEDVTFSPSKNSWTKSTTTNTDDTWSYTSSDVTVKVLFAKKNQSSSMASSTIQVKSSDKATITVSSTSANINITKVEFTAKGHKSTTTLKFGETSLEFSNDVASKTFDTAIQSADFVISTGKNSEEIEGITVTTTDTKKGITSISLSPTTCTSGGTYTPTLTVKSDEAELQSSDYGTVTYTSSNTDALSYSDGTFTVGTVTEETTVTLTVSIAESDTYNSYSGEVSVTVSPAATPKSEGTELFSYTWNGSGSKDWADKTQTQNNIKVALSSDSKDNFNIAKNGGSGTITINSSNGTITKVEMTFETAREATYKVGEGTAVDFNATSLTLTSTEGISGTSATITLTNNANSFLKLTAIKVYTDGTAVEKVTPNLTATLESSTIKVGDTPYIKLKTSTDGYDYSKGGVTYTSSDEDVIPVGDEGELAAASKVGTATITITAGAYGNYTEAKTSVTVTVEEADAAPVITFSPTSVTCKKGETPTAPTMTIAMSDDGTKTGTLSEDKTFFTLNGTTYSLAYKSSSESKITVDASGTLGEAKKTGSATIKVSFKYNNKTLVYTYSVDILASSTETTSTTEFAVKSTDKYTAESSITSVKGITMTWGGVKGASKGTSYSNRNKEGFLSTNDDAIRESYADNLKEKSFNHSLASTSTALFDRMMNLPVYGDYFKFEPTTDGTLTIDVEQQGAIYSDNDGYVPQWIRVRPLYCVDELGISQKVCVPPVTKSKIDSAWVTVTKTTKAESATIKVSEDKDVKKSSTMFTAEQMEQIQKFYTQCIADNPTTIVAGSDESTNTVVPIFTLHTGDKEGGIVVGGTAYDYSETALGYLKDVQKAYNYGDEDENLDSTGYFTLSKAEVTYKFHLLAGKTYFIFTTRSKLGLGSFSFEADATKPTATDITIDATKSDNLNGATTGNRYNVTLRRAFQANKWHSLVLPFSVGPSALKSAFGDEVKVVTFDNFDGSTLTLKKHFHQMIVAGMPVFIRPSKAVESVTFDNVVLGSTTTGEVKDGTYTMKGTYQKGDLMPQYSIFLNGNALKQYQGTGKKSINATLCWIEGATENITTATSTSAKIISFDGETEDETTGIISIEPDDEEADGAVFANGVYNISGQLVGASLKLNSLSSGVYICGGKKYVVK